MTEEIGLAQPVEYTEAERRTIATHEAGHATVAWLVGKGRKLEVLSIIKRKDALGPAQPLRGGGALHQDPVRDRGAHPDRLRRHGGRGAVLRRDLARGWPATCRPPPRTPVRWSGSWGWAPRSSRRRPWSTRPGASCPRCWPTTTDAPRWSPLLGASKDSVTRMLDEHRNVVEALRDALLEREELIGDDILQVIRESQPSGAPVGGERSNRTGRPEGVRPRISPDAPAPVD